MRKALVAAAAIVALLSGASQAQTIQKRSPRHGEDLTLLANPMDARAQAGSVLDRQDPARVKPDGTFYPANDPTPHYMRIYHGAPYGE